MDNHYLNVPPRKYYKNAWESTLGDLNEEAIFVHQLLELVRLNHIFLADANDAELVDEFTGRVIITLYEELELKERIKPHFIPNSTTLIEYRCYAIRVIMDVMFYFFQNDNSNLMLNEFS